MESTLIECHKRETALRKGNFGRLKGQRILNLINYLNYNFYLSYSTIYYFR